MATPSIIDRRNGEGVTLSLSSVSGTATVYVARYVGDVARNTFSTVHTATEDVEDQDITLAVGAYVAVVVDDGGPSPPVGFRVTDGTDGIHHRCLQAIRDHIVALSLPSFPTDDTKYKLHKRPINSFKEFTEWAGSGRENQSQIIGVHFWKRPERVRQVYNQKHGIEYKIEMVLVRSRQGNNIADPDWTHDRERIIESFPTCPLRAVDEVYQVTFIPGLIYSDTGNGIDLDTQSIQFVCLAEKSSVAT